MGEYKRIRYEDRLKIAGMLKNGSTKQEIAGQIGKHRTSIERELKRGAYVHRNSDGTEEVRYSPELAEESYQKQLREKGPQRKLEKDRELEAYLKEKMKEHQSPYMAVKALKEEEKEFRESVSYGTIYNYIKNGVLPTPDEIKISLKREAVLSVYDLTLLNKVEDVNGKLIKEFEPSLYKQISEDEISSYTFGLLQQGMEQMVERDKRFDSVREGGIQMSGKTGTAQESKAHADHVLFVGYAPSTEPQIAFSARITNGYNSGYPAEIGRDMVRKYFNLANDSELLSGSAASLGIEVRGD